MPRTCLILEAVPLVAQDLALTARDSFGLEPAIAGDEDTARSLLAAAPDARVELAFIHQDAATFADSPLHRQLKAQGARIVLLGTEVRAPQDGAGWQVLRLPFTTDQLVALVKGPGRGVDGTLAP